MLRAIASWSYVLVLTICKYRGCAQPYGRLIDHSPTVQTLEIGKFIVTVGKKILSLVKL